MPDVRIKDLATEISAFADDDFAELDGATNGSRKMRLGRVLAAHRNALTPRGGVVLDGTASTRIYSTLTGQSIGTDAFSFAITFKVLSAAPAADVGLFGIGPSATAPNGANSVYSQITTEGDLRFYCVNSAGNGYGRVDIANCITRFGGKVVSLVFVRNTAGAPSVYINGVAESVTVLNVGTAPYDFLQSVTSTYLAVGFVSSTVVYTSTIHSASLYNLALSQTDVNEIYELGGAVPYRFQFGTQSILYTSDFSAGLDSWSDIGGNTNTGNVDAINGQDDWVKFERTVAGAGRMDSDRSITGKTAGKVYRLRVRCYNPAGSTIDGVSFQIDTYITSGVQAMPANTQTDIDLVFPVSRDTTSVKIDPRTGGTQTNANGQFVYFKNYRLNQVGAVVHLPLDDGIGYQLHDQSTNKLDAVMTATGVAHLITKRTGYVRTPGSGLSWSATHEVKSILGVAQRALPDGSVVELATLKASVGSSGAGATLGTTNSATRWSAAAVFTAAKKTLTLANQLPAGTADADTDILLDPDTVNITATIQAEVHYKLTEGS